MSDTVNTIEDFLQVVRKSGLVEDAALEQAVAAWPDRAAALPEELIQSLIDTELLTKWQTDQLRKGRHKGFVLGKYRLLRLLGAGGMSSVYLAEHTTLHGKAAIKVLPVKRVDQTSYLARFEREARAAYRLSHPHIVRTIDLESAGTIHFLAMEYIDGVDLHAKVKQDGPLPIRDAVDYLRQAALGLQYAHDEGFVHRDIKPANLILDKRGTVKILDLGLALGGEDEEDSLTKEHGEKVLGTADYLAPEQAQDSHKADRRSDIYALGCTLHYLLTGRPPFPKGTLAERIQAHMRTPPPNLLDERADVPPAIAELYFRMMEKHPDARPQSAKEISDAFALWLATTQPTDGSRPAAPPRRPPPRRTPAAAAGASGSSDIHAQPVGVATPPRGGRSGSGVGTGSGPFAGFGSGSSSGVGSASGVGSDPFAFTSAPQPSRRGPGAASHGGSGKSGIGHHAGDASHHDAKRIKQESGLSQVVLGLPVGVWLALGVGLIIAAVLTLMLLASEKPKKTRKAKDDQTQSSPAGPVPKPSASTRTNPRGRGGNNAQPAAGQSPPADQPVEGGLDAVLKGAASPAADAPPAESAGPDAGGDPVGDGK